MEDTPGRMELWPLIGALDYFGADNLTYIFHLLSGAYPGTWGYLSFTIREDVSFSIKLDVEALAVSGMILH